MSVSVNYLRSALERPPPPPAFRPRVGGSPPDLEQLLRNAQNRFKAPHRRDYGYRLPVPFCWGPQGSLLLLSAMLAGYVLIVAAAVVLIPA